MKKTNRYEMKTLDQLVTHDQREPVSTRIKESSVKVFKGEAKRLGVSVSSLLAAILDDYADWVKAGSK
jgi:hypothetical protein